MIPKHGNRSWSSKSRVERRWLHRIRLCHNSPLQRSSIMETGMIVGGVLLAVAALVILTITRLIIIVPPNMAAAITGRDRALDDGGTVGYRTVTGGRTLRIPIIEKVQWLSLSTIPLEISVQDAYSKGNIPLSVQAVANVKIASAPETVFNNAVERLLDKDQEEIERLARETLTG